MKFMKKIKDFFSLPAEDVLLIKTAALMGVVIFVLLTGLMFIGETVDNKCDTDISVTCACPDHTV